MIRCILRFLIKPLLLAVLALGLFMPAQAVQARGFGGPGGFHGFHGFHDFHGFHGFHGGHHYYYYAYPYLFAYPYLYNYYETPYYDQPYQAHAYPSYQANCASGLWRQEDGSIVNGVACQRADGSWQLR